MGWNMVLYGEELERELAESKDPVLQRFWRGKEVAEYSEFPYERASKLKSFFETPTLFWVVAYHKHIHLLWKKAPIFIYFL